MGLAIQNASRFLRRWKIRVEDLPRFVRPLDPAETLMLVGSVPEGLANPLSDVDLSFIGDRELDQGVVVNEASFQELSINLEDGPEINVNYWRAKDLEELEERLKQTFVLINDPALVAAEAKLRKLERFDFTELLILHRIRVGIALANPEICERWRERLQLDQLPTYVILHGLSNHNIYREDVIAQVRYGDSLSALAMLRIMIDHLATAVLASVGETNPYPKWRVRLLNWYRGDLGDETVEQFMRFLFPERSTDASATVRDALEFADREMVAIATRCPQTIAALVTLDKLFVFVKQSDEIRPQERSLPQ